jgi:hypothetical protein
MSKRLGRLFSALYKFHASAHWCLRYCKRASECRFGVIGESRLDGQPTAVARFLQFAKAGHASRARVMRLILRMNSRVGRASLATDRAKPTQRPISDGISSDNASRSELMLLCFHRKPCVIPTNDAPAYNQLQRAYLI